MIDEPLEEQVMAAIATALNDLSGVRPGGWAYPRTPGVERVLPPPTGQQMPSDQLPRLFVVPGRESTLLTPSGVGQRTRTYQHNLNVDIHGLVEATDGVLGDTWRWRLREDVLQVLHLNITLGGLVRTIDFVARRESVDAGEVAPKIWFLQPITVWLLKSYATAT